MGNSHDSRCGSRKSRTKLEIFAHIAAAITKLTIRLSTANWQYNPAYNPGLVSAMHLIANNRAITLRHKIT